MRLRLERCHRAYQSKLQLRLPYELLRWERAIAASLGSYWRTDERPAQDEPLYLPFPCKSRTEAIRDQSRSRRGRRESPVLFRCTVRGETVESTATAANSARNDVATGSAYNNDCSGLRNRNCHSHSYASSAEMEFGAISPLQRFG